MKKFFFNTIRYATLAGIALVLFSGVMLIGIGTGNPDHVATASRETVLLQRESPGGFGSGVTVKRQTPLGNTVVFIWTAAHNVTGVNEVLVNQVVRKDFKRVGVVQNPAHVILRDSMNDLALLQVSGETEGYTSTEFDADVPPSLGSPVFHVGNLYGPVFDGSVSFGVVAQHGVGTTGFPWPVADTTDALILPGSSGGGLFRPATGKLIGIAVGSQSGRIGIYVPVRVLRRLAPWAVDGQRCPSIYDLSGLAVNAQVHPPRTLEGLLFELPCQP